MSGGVVSLERTTDRSSSDVPVALSQPQQGETRLRFQPEAARLPIGRFGGSEVALQAMYLTLSIRGVAESPFVQGSLRESLSDPSRFFEGVPPQAPQRHDLGAMHEAQPLVGDHVGLLLAPPRQRAGPLAGAS